MGTGAVRCKAELISVSLHQSRSLAMALSEVCSPCTPSARIVYEKIPSPDKRDRSRSLGGSMQVIGYRFFVLKARVTGSGAAPAVERTDIAGRLRCACEDYEGYVG